LFKTNGERALLLIGVFTLVFIALAGILGIGANSLADSDEVQAVVEQYFERLPADSNRISGADLIDFIRFNKDGLYIVDIRDAKDYAISHIEGAINVPYREIGEQFKNFPKDKTIVVYCYSGQNGGQVASLLNIAGYNVKSLSSGWGGWLQVSEPETTTEDAAASCS